MPPPLTPTAVTDARTGTAHLVTDAAVAAGRPAGSYTALCGVSVLATSLTAPTGRPCPSCVRVTR
ncbi:MAG: hypothetical protein M3R63_21990 [Actinomycetota bacterium]|nr:hypothetical protein [Actinomycetota bacterium]